jgi:hypothetical protein
MILSPMEITLSGRKAGHGDWPGDDTLDYSTVR